jgi:5-methylcytosine-specific restriction endonuclease McrA
MKKKKRKLRQDIKKRVGERDDYTCYICGRTVPNMTVDHIQPECRGGTDDLDNLAACCHKCNQLKRDMTLTELVFKLFSDATVGARQVGLDIDLFQTIRT